MTKEYTNWEEGELMWDTKYKEKFEFDSNRDKYILDRIERYSGQDKQTNSWEKEFDKRFGEYWTKVGDKLYQAFPHAPETMPILIPREGIINFISKTISQEREKWDSEHEYIIKILSDFLTPTQRNQALSKLYTQGITRITEKLEK